MTLLVIIFGLMSGTLMSVLVGLLGRSRRIGFGLAFLLSIIFTPLIGLIITLFSEPNYGDDRGVGCIGVVLGLVALLCLLPLILLFMGLLVL
ncbi:MAG: hypothetical protein R3Y68_01255 [Rikenellaceae bacterium]